jgi:[acyl-carrier-protein] S-malonyltransferase
LSVISYLFTGAGYQYVNLGKKAYDSSWLVRQHYDKIEKKYPEFRINKLSFIGPVEDLMREENGIIINAVYQRGIFDVLKDYKVTPEQIFGYKSGELMALACAEAISFEDAFDFLFKKRQMIIEVVKMGFYHHFLVNTIPTVQLEKVMEELKGSIRTEIVCYNGKDSNIIICEAAAKEKLAELFKKMGGAVIAIPHEESACFSDLKNVADRLKDEFKKIAMDKPIHRIVCQTTGGYYDNVQEIKEKFTDYIYKPCRLDLALETMLKNGVNTFVEVGPGTFLSRMARKRDSGKRALNTNDLGELSKTVKLAN